MDDAEQGRKRTHRFDGVTVDPAALRLTAGGRSRPISPRAFAVLTYLIEHRDRVVEKQELFEQVWRERFVTDAALAQTIKEIRQAIGDDGRSPRYIKTVYKHGYRFVAPLNTGGDSEAPVSSFSRRSILILGTVVALLTVAGTIYLRTARSGPPSGSIRSLAVLPLKNLSGDPGQDYFADGMTDAIITELGKASPARVISYQSVLPYKNTEKTLPRIADELSVDAVVEGAVLLSDDSVRITAQLMEVSPERHLWAESYEGQLDDVLHLQRRVALSVVREIQGTLSSGYAMRSARARQVVPEAYQLYLKGRHHWSRFGGGNDFEKSIDYIKQSLARDPSFAPAYVGLADASIGRGFFRLLSGEELAEVKTYANRALELDDSLDEAHRILAQTAFYIEWDWSVAERELRSTLEINPSAAPAYDLYANLHLTLGHFDEAVEARKVCIELDPLSHVFNCNGGFTFYWARHYQDAIGQATRNLELFGFDCPSEYAVAAKAYGQMGRFDKAIDWLEKCPRQPLPPIRAELAYSLARQGRTKEAREILDSLTRKKADPYFLAQIHVGLGDREAAPVGPCGGL